MTDEVSSRARRRATEARARAAEAGARRAELAADVRMPPDEAVARSQAHLARAAQLAKEGCVHAAEAERAAARSHDQLADLLEMRAKQQPYESVRLHEEAQEHRDSAAEHRDNAKIDEQILNRLTRREAGEST